MEKQQKQVNQFRKISMAEGASFLILLFIAMPLKYLADIPAAVKYVGWLHGVLFIAYIFQLLYLGSELKWSLKRIFVYFVAAFLPIAPFVVEKRLKKEYC
jgi:integral membrane protein